VNGSHTQRSSTPWTFLPLLILVTIVVALLVGVAPALAYGGWTHDDGMNKASCTDPSYGCHSDHPATNLTCVGCHPGRTTAGSKMCWDCHEPGTAPPSSCAATCHVFKATGEEDYDYQTAFTHGTTPHLGASGYGKTCADCHTAGNVHHDASAGHQPACAECHNGTTAKLPPSSHNDGLHANCASCHDGMSLPSCAGCHVGNPGSGGPQIGYSNSLSCGDAACHGKVKNHAGTSITAAACTTCHAPHFASLGTCTKCHADPKRFHHGIDHATPLAECAGCHNGAIATAPTGHEAYGTRCATCHTGMNRPSGDCATCHIGSTTSRAPQVTYTNDLRCADAGCHAKIVTHSGTPITGAACTACHAPHFASLGTCTKCHTDPKRFHHGTAKAPPLAECGSCHDGKIAAAKKSHAGQACTVCHTGMARPPVPATCQNCHDAQTFGAGLCTTCHSTSGMIGKETVHAADPAATVACTTCHTAHYEDLGACGSCHGSHAETHHATATLADTQLTLKAKPAKVSGHTNARLRGSLLAADGQALASQSVLIQRKLKDGSFKKVGVVKTGAKGAYTRVVKLRFGTEYRAVWRPAGAYVTQQRPAVVTAKLLRVRK